MLLDGAHWLLLLLDEDGLASFPKTTGNRGIHVHVPLGPGRDSYDVRLGAVAVARELERRRPELITAAWWSEERGRRVFIDSTQNARSEERGVGKECVRTCTSRWQAYQ